MGRTGVASLALAAALAFVRLVLRHHLRGGGQALLVFSGGPAGVSPTPSTIIQTGQSLSLFPASSSGAGDVNGDGLADLIAAAPRLDTSGGGFIGGRVYAFHASPSFQQGAARCG